MEGGVSVLQYADDTIICLKHNLEGARNLKLLLYIYELMTGLKINLYKSEVMIINDEDGWDAIYALPNWKFLYKVSWGTYQPL